MDSDISKLKIEIDKAITHSTTKLISPLLILFYLEHVEKTKNPVFENNLVKEGYEEIVCNFIRNYLHHNFNIGGTFNDTYISRLSYRHRFLRQISQKAFAVQEDYFSNAKELASYTKMKIEEHLNLKLGNLITLKRLIESGHDDIEGIDEKRKYLGEVLHDNSSKRFREFLETGFDKNPKGF